MIRLCLKIVGALTLVTSLLIALSILFGALKPVKAALAGFEVCDDGIPCWLGIDILHDDAETMNRRLIEGGYQGEPSMTVYSSPDANCDVVVNRPFDSDIIMSLQLIYCHDLLIGDLIGIYGEPQAVGINGFCDWILKYPGSMLVYVDGQIIPGLGNVALLPSRRVVQIDFVPNLLSEDMIGAGWHGFVSLWVYRQFNSLMFANTCL